MSIFGFTDNLREWEDNFRGNIYAQFERAVFGRRPKDIPDQNLAAETGPERIAGGVVSRDVTLRHKGASFGFTLFCPVMQPDEQAPCIIYILHPQQASRAHRAPKTFGCKRVAGRMGGSRRKALGGKTGFRRRI